MSLVEEISSPLRSHQPSVSAPPHWRLPVLGLLLLCSLATETGFLTNHFYRDGPLFPFMLFFLVGLLLYLATCTTVLTTKGQPGKWRWFELALILGGALVLRCILLGIDPFLSPDSWRYLWDARVTLHGYSPYVYAPLDPLLQSLRDASYDRMAYHNVPTIYPPGAQAIYLLSYLIAPGSLVALKGVFVLFDLTTCIALTYLLLRRKLDPARVLIYAWCPLPIMEFAIQGHLDVLAITFTVLAMTSNLATWKGSRA
ncbi:MAG: hypothetical protein J2P37_12700, partial [Ktedonobacteraceae bacterium]|nr:hypothetical protein [Ktedonobacteraceae bacterium]